MGLVTGCCIGVSTLLNAIVKAGTVFQRQSTDQGCSVRGRCQIGALQPMELAIIRVDRNVVDGRRHRLAM